MIGRNFFSEIAPCAQVQEFRGRFDEAIADDMVATFAFVFPFPDNPRAVAITLTGFEHQGSRLCMISVNDTTEEERVRAEILQAERFRELGEVAATVAHNFNNLLTIVRGNADLMLDDLTSEDLKRQCRDIIQAADDGETLVRRVRQTVAGAAPTDVAPVAINPIVSDAVDSIRRTNATGTILTASTAGDVGSARVLPSELREVLFNLLRNAIDATEGRSQPRVEVTTSRAGRRIRITVKDNGSGMSEEVQRRLFQPLFTTKGNRGTGLGLASSFALMRRYGGTIDVHSTEGAGSEIAVSLPEAASAIQP